MGIGCPGVSLAQIIVSTVLGSLVWCELSTTHRTCLRTYSILVLHIIYIKLLLHLISTGIIIEISFKKIKNALNILTSFPTLLDPNLCYVACLTFMSMPLHIQAFIRSLLLKTSRCKSLLFAPYNHFNNNNILVMNFADYLCILSKNANILPIWYE